MSLRNGHGTGRGTPRIEVRPPDEQPSPVAAPLTPPVVPLRFREDGTIADSETARAMGRKGGQEKAKKVRLVHSLGLSNLVGETTFGPYRSAADAFVEHHLAELAQMAGGRVDAAPSTMVASAALQLAASRWAFDRGAEQSDPALFKLGSTLANDSRQNLLAAYELAVRCARVRPVGAGLPPWMQVTEPEVTESPTKGPPTEGSGS